MDPDGRVFGFRDPSQWIRLEISCPTVVNISRDLEYGPRSCKKQISIKNMESGVPVALQGHLFPPQMGPFRKKYGIRCPHCLAVAFCFTKNGSSTPKYCVWEGSSALKYCACAQNLANWNSPAPPALLPIQVSSTAARSLPSTRAGGQDDGSLTNSLKPVVPAIG